MRASFVGMLCPSYATHQWLGEESMDDSYNAVLLPSVFDWKQFVARSFALTTHTLAPQGVSEK